MAMLQNQAKNITCQKVNLLCPSRGVPVQILSFAFAQKSETDLTPRLGKTAIAAAINTRIIHGSSILTAVAETGLSLYKFGKTVTLPFPEKSTADSVLNAIEENNEHGLHTLILFDLDAETGRYLTVKQATDILMETKNSSPFDIDTLIVGVSRLGSDGQAIRAGRAEDIARMNFGEPPHAIIVPSQLHFLEAEALRILCGCPEEVLRKVELKVTLNQLIEKYTKSCLRVLEELRLGILPREVREEEVKDLIEHAERYLGDAVYYTQRKKLTALSSISYSEGILDALRLLGLIEFNW